MATVCLGVGERSSDGSAEKVSGVSVKRGEILWCETQRFVSQQPDSNSLFGSVSEEEHSRAVWAEHAARKPIVDQKVRK
jgi:hypothetical protein